MQPFPTFDAAPASAPRPRLRERGGIRFLWEIGETVVLIAAIYALVNLASARFIVEGDSMQPNFHSGQFIIVSRLNYLLGMPHRGDIVVFHFPLDPEQDYIKRVIGLPNQTVELRDTHVYVDGTELNEPYINEACTPVRCPNKTWQIGPTEYFVMGDNRNHSDDSRIFGPVDQRFIVGEALVRYWPPKDWAIVRQIRFNGGTVTQ